jgi:hypothetical protein
MKTSLLTSILAMILIPAAVLSGQSTSTPKPASGTTAKTTADVNVVSVAIIDFESKAPGNADLGKQLGDILTARLSVYSQFQLVDRRNMEDLLKEHQLSLSGLTDTGQVIQVGKVVGAKIMIFGSVFAVEKELYIAAKIVGVETSQVKGILATGKLESSLSELIGQLSDKLIDGLNKWTPELLPKSENFQNPLVAIKEQLKDKKLPTVAVMVSETHASRPVVGDPAAETEIKKVLKEVGFNVIEADRQTLEKWSKDYSMQGVDIIITGQGFSEFGARLGGLVSCSARLEIQATERESHKVISSQRTTRRAVDLSENIAAKTVLQAAGHELAVKTITEIAKGITETNKPASESK